MSLIARRLLLPLLALCAAVAAPLAGWGRALYKVDRSHAFVHFEVSHLGIFPYPGRFKQFRIEAGLRSGKC